MRGRLVGDESGGVKGGSVLTLMGNRSETRLSSFGGGLSGETGRGEPVDGLLDLDDVLGGDPGGDLRLSGRGSGRNGLSGSDLGSVLDRLKVPVRLFGEESALEDHDGGRAETAKSSGIGETGRGVADAFWAEVLIMCCVKATAGVLFMFICPWPGRPTSWCHHTGY